MLAYLDEECLRPGKATDETLLLKFNQRCLDHPHYESRATKHLLSDQTLSREEFRLVHYAGKVEHSLAINFCSSNINCISSYRCNMTLWVSWIRIRIFYSKISPKQCMLVKEDCSRNSSLRVITLDFLSLLPSINTLD